LINLVKAANPEQVQLEIVRAQSNLTIQSAMAQEHQISFLRKENERVLEYVISLLIETLAMQFNVKESFSGLQIVDCTLSVLEKYWYLRPEEIMYVFKQGKLGAYGPVYNKLDAPTILTWIHKYDTDERIRQVEITRDQFKSEENQPQIDIVKAYQTEQKAIEANGGIPTLVVESRQKQEQKKAQRYNDIQFEEFKDQYFKNKESINQ
jgi:hypothetical protein